MELTGLSNHTSAAYNSDFESIHNLLLEMGGMIENQIENALTALANNDFALAEKVIAKDVDINHLELRIDEQCTRVLALRVPAARDLRFVQSIIRSTTDLERIGDEIKRIAKMVTANSSGEFEADLMQKIIQFGKLVQQNIKRVLDSFVRMDVQMCLEVASADDQIDQEYKAILEQLISYMKADPECIPRSLDLLWSVRSLERIGDRCQNLSEYIIYYVEGKDVRHTSPEDLQEAYSTSVD